MKLFLVMPYYRSPTTALLKLTAFLAACQEMVRWGP